MAEIITGERISELVFKILGWQVKKSDKYNNYRSLNEKVYFREWLSNSWHLSFKTKKETINSEHNIEVNYFRIKTEKDIKKILRHFKKLNAISKTSISNERPKDFI